MSTTHAAVTIAALTPDDLDVGLVAHYGDPNGEQRTLATTVGLVDRGNRGVIAVTGLDRLSWLHSLTTQHLTDLAPMTGTELLLLSPNGHVEHHAVVLDDGTTTLLDVEPATAGPLSEFLNRMRFLLRVDPVDVSADWAVLSLVGPDAQAALGRVGVPDLRAPVIAAVPDAKFATGAAGPGATSIYPVAALPGTDGPAPALAGTDGGFVRRMPYGYDLLVPRRAIEAWRAALDVPLAGVWAFEALRVADRRPRLGRDTDHRTLPAEVGWTAGAVHLEKGCYRGQETVARVHHLGRPPRHLVLLHLDGIATDELPASGTPVTTAEGRAVGFVGTAARHYELGQIALALVKRNVEAGTDLRVGPSAAAVDPS